MAIPRRQIGGPARTSSAGFGSPLRLGLTCLLALGLVACRPTPHASPTALRNTNDYFKATSPAAPPALDPQALDRIKLTREGQTLVVTAPLSPVASGPEDGFAHTLKRLEPGQKLEGAGARFELVGLAVTGPGLSKTNSSHDAPLDFFGPDGKKLSPEQLKTLGFKPWQLRDSLTGSSSGIDDAFPKLRVELGSPRQPPGYYSVVGLFDARTKASLVTGYAYSQVAHDYLGEVNLHPHLWHAAPTELVLDVELDGKTVVQSAPTPGTKVKVPGGQVLWLGLWDGAASSWSTQGGPGPGNLRITLSQAEDRPSAVGLFVTEPPKLAVHVDLLDARGQPLEGNGASTSGAIRFAGVRSRAADVNQVRLTVFTNHHCVVLPLPPFPNLPAENQQPTDLLAVRIPHAQVRSESDLRQLIGDTTQFHFAYPPGGDLMPTNLFPMLLTNTSPAQLLETYRHHVPKGSTIVIDEPKSEIRVDLLPLEKVKRWVRQLLP